MNEVDLLSDTVYRDRAAQYLNGGLGRWRKIPVKKAQIYGLREIARNEPDRVADFARHQRQRADAKGKRLEEEFWQLVESLWGRPNAEWSVVAEGKIRLREDLRDENIPESRKGMSHEERRHRNRLKVEQRDWIRQWRRRHVPAFFERFCSHALYLLAQSSR